MPQLVASRGYGTSSLFPNIDGERLISSFGYGSFVVIPSRNARGQSRQAGAGGGLKLAILDRPIDAICPPDLTPTICAILPGSLEPMVPPVGTPLTSKTVSENIDALAAVIEMNTLVPGQTRRERRKRRADLRKQLRKRLRREMRRQLNRERAEVEAEMAALRAQQGGVVTDMQRRHYQMQLQLGALRTELNQRRSAQRWLIAIGVAVAAYLAWRWWRRRNGEDVKPLNLPPLRNTC